MPNRRTARTVATAARPSSQGRSDYQQHAGPDVDEGRWPTRRRRSAKLVCPITESLPKCDASRARRRRRQRSQSDITLVLIQVLVKAAQDSSETEADSRGRRGRDGSAPRVARQVTTVVGCTGRAPASTNRLHQFLCSGRGSRVRSSSARSFRVRINVSRAL